MSEPARRVATYEDVLAAPKNLILEVLELVNNRWVLVSSGSDEANVRAVPFDAIGLELGVLWEDVAW